jgi:hypothetical protein
MNEDETLITTEYIKNLDGELMVQALVGAVGLEKTRKILEHYELLKEQISENSNR